MTLSIAIDYVKKGIRCNCICPARIHTPFVDGYLAKNYPGREAEMFEKLSADPADRPHGHAGRGGVPRALPLLRRGGVRHRPGVSHRRRSARDMKLIRFGAPGQEKPGVAARRTATRIDASAFGADYDEAFFGGDGLARARAPGWRERGARAPRVAGRRAAGPADRAPEQDRLHRPQLPRPRRRERRWSCRRSR